MFRDGAMTGAFSRLFNDEHTVKMARGRLAEMWTGWLRGAANIGYAFGGATLPVAGLGAPVLAGAAGVDFLADRIQPRPSVYGSDSIDGALAVGTEAIDRAGDLPNEPSPGHFSKGVTLMDAVFNLLDPNRHGN